MVLFLRYHLKQAEEKLHTIFEVSHVENSFNVPTLPIFSDSTSTMISLYVFFRMVAEGQFINFFQFYVFGGSCFMFPSFFHDFRNIRCHSFFPLVILLKFNIPLLNACYGVFYSIPSCSYVRFKFSFFHFYLKFETYLCFQIINV